MNKALRGAALLLALGLPAAGADEYERPRWNQQLDICEECFLATVPGTELTPGEVRFFEGTPERAYIEVHDEDSAKDLHTIFFSVVGLTELEIFRVADWIIDLPLPGSLRPFNRLFYGLRSGHRRLPQMTPVRRVGEFADALQIPELSFGDVSAAYNASSGGLGIGSGTLYRFDRLIDWTQHVTGDLNRAAGWPVRMRRGLVPVEFPGRFVDALQWLITQTFHQVEIFVSRTVDNSLLGIEAIAEKMVNVAYRPPYSERVVFLQMPVEVYREHQAWLEENYPRLVMGTKRKFLDNSYLELTEHWHRETALPPMLDVLSDSDTVVLMLQNAAFKQAPEEFAQYVVPAAWVLNP